MTDDTLWQAIRAIWRESANTLNRRVGRPSVSSDIAKLLFPGRAKGSKAVKRFHLDRTMMREAWFASLSIARQQNGQGNQPRKIDSPMAASERLSKFRKPKEKKIA